MKTINVYYISEAGRIGAFATEFNVSHSEAREYYLGNEFNLGVGENDKMVLVCAIVYDGKPADLAVLPKGLPSSAVDAINRAFKELAQSAELAVYDGE